MTLITTTYGWGDAPADADVLWRVEGRYREARFSFMREHSQDEHVEVQLYWYRIHKRTPCGAWIHDGRDRRFILLTKTRRKWAWPTKEEALISFQKRKEHQIAILQWQLKVAKLGLKYAKKSLTRKHLRAIAA